MTLRRYLVPLLFIAVPALLLSCSGDDDDEKPRATCESICAQQNSLCQTTRDCGMRCALVPEVLNKTGCGREYQEALDCLAEKNACDPDATLCPAVSFYGCVDQYCAANPNDSLCDD